MSIAETSMKISALTQPARRETTLLRALADVVRDAQRSWFATYHPERHYMRGPGPACAAKRTGRR